MSITKSRLLKDRTAARIDQDIVAAINALEVLTETARNAQKALIDARRNPMAGPWPYRQLSGGYLLAGQAVTAEVAMAGAYSSMMTLSESDLTLSTEEV